MFGDLTHQPIRNQGDAEERRDGNGTFHRIALRDPCGQQTAQRKTGNGNPFAKLLRDLDVLGNGVVEFLGTKPLECG